MASGLTNEVCCIMHCRGNYEKNSIVNSVLVDDWKTEWAIIPSNTHIILFTVVFIFMPFLFLYLFRYARCAPSLEQPKWLLLCGWWPPSAPARSSSWRSLRRRITTTAPLLTFAGRTYSFHGNRPTSSSSWYFFLRVPTIRPDDRLRADL